MKAIDVVRTALMMSDMSIMMLAEDLRSMPMTQPTDRGGNHPLWVMGHITFVEASMRHVLFGEPHPLAAWGALFAPGTEPSTDPSAYPPFDEVVQTYRRHRQDNMQLLDEIGEAGLDQPTKAPPKGLEDALGTFGNAFLVIAMHHMNHRGQLADARRAAGRKPIFTPGI